MKGRALITGASAGIGLELAREFARNGHDVILAARNGARLNELAQSLTRVFGIDARVVPVDFAAPGAAEELLRNIADIGLTVDILVNNAGIGVFGLFAETDAKKERDMLRINQEVPVELCKLLIPGMLARKSGGILNVASTAAYQPGPRMALYYAGKAFLLSFGIALHEELRNTGVTVTTLCPGPTRSEFQVSMGVNDKPGIQRMSMPAEKVAKVGYAGLMRGRCVATPGLQNRLGTALGKMLPWTWVARVVGKIQTARLNNPVI